MTFATSLTTTNTGFCPFSAKFWQLFQNINQKRIEMKQKQEISGPNSSIGCKRNRNLIGDRWREPQKNCGIFGMIQE